jgi:hypothetical protein
MPANDGHAIGDYRGVASVALLFRQVSTDII